MQLAVLYDRIGPYHHARLNSLGQKTDLTAVEFSATDQTYSWEAVTEAGSYKRVTLFIDKPVERHSPSDVVRRISGVLEDIQPRVVAIPGWDAPAALMALRWCLRTGTPTILMSESQIHDHVRIWWKERVKSRIVRLHSTGFVGGRPHVAYLKALGMPAGQIFTGYDAVDNEFFAGRAEAIQRNASYERERLSLPEHFFLASGRFVEKKNLPFLLDSYAKYRAAIGKEGWGLVVLGDGPFKDQLFKLRGRLGLGDSVIFPGFRQYNELPAYYGLASAFVHTSTSEQWGLVVNEAMACGLPVIVSSPCGCVPDLVQNGVNGFVFDPCNTEELARHLEYMTNNNDARVAMGEASRRMIADWNLAPMPPS